MLTADRIAAAAQTLLGHHRGNTKFDALAAEHRPADRHDGYAVQAALRPDAKLFGWKIAATSEAGQKHINVPGPMAGRIFADRVIADGGETSLAGNAMLVAEPEFAFRFGRTLPPRAAPYSVDEVLDAVASLHPAIEIPDSRFANFVTSGEAQIVADNACAHEFVLGPATTCDWRARDLVEEKPVIALRGAHYVGHGRNVLGDPRVALAWLVNELSSLGIALNEGEIVTTGTCHVPLQIQPGDTVDADFGALGRVSVSFRA